MRKAAMLGAIGFAFALGLFQADAPQPGISRAEAKVCYKGGQAYGKVASGVRKSKAQERARGKWRDYAVKLMGTTRINWSSAMYQGYSCKKKGIWYCRAIATPCL